jgi:hypothetical protein
VAGFRDFLRTEGRPAEIAWAFREDFYSVGPLRHRVVWPLPPENEVHARALFIAGQSSGLVELAALFHVGERTVATVFAPDPGAVQGWSHGLKLSAHLPWVAARPISNGLAWRFYRVLRSYRRFQRIAGFVARREDIAA